MPGRTVRMQAAITALTLMAVAVAACGTLRPSSRRAIPSELKAACGHPGTHVRVHKVPTTVRHADCNLTGVVISYRRYSGATVPGDGTSVGTSNGFTGQSAPRRSSVVGRSRYGCCALALDVSIPLTTAAPGVSRTEREVYRASAS